MTITYLPHPAYAAVLKVERAFTADEAQAESRAVLVIRTLHMEGHLCDVEFRGGLPMIPAEGTARR